MFLGILRVTTILLFGAACLIVAPSCYTVDNPWYITPLGMFWFREQETQELFAKYFGQ